MKRLLVALAMTVAAAVGFLAADPFDSSADLYGSDAWPSDRGEADSASGGLPDLQVASEPPTDSLVDGKPPELTSPEASLDDVTGIAEQGDSTATGESFAAHLAQLLTDTRQPLDVERLIDDLVADEFSARNRAFLVDNLGTEYDHKFGRRCVTTEDAWIRTNAGAAGVLQIEIAFVEATDLFPGHLRWPVLRLDVSHDGDTWKLHDLGARQIYLPGAEDESDYLLEGHLDGDGWRRIAPVD